MALEPDTMPVSRSAPLLAWIAARPKRALAAFLALHAVVWTALPTALGVAGGRPASGQVAGNG